MQLLKYKHFYGDAKCFFLFDVKVLSTITKSFRRLGASD